MTTQELHDAIRRDISARLDSGDYERPDPVINEADEIEGQILDRAAELLRSIVSPAPLNVDEVKLDPGDPLGLWVRFAALLDGAREALSSSSAMR